MSKILHVVADRRIMGEIECNKHGRLTFVYDNDWRSMEQAYPLSFSMTLHARLYKHAAFEPWLWGLLPDNSRILNAWGKQFQVSPRNVFALLANTGEDCAGAVQLTRPDRLDHILRGDGSGQHVEWLTESDIAKRLAVLRMGPAAWCSPRDIGWFSLAGAQPKTALLFDGTRWGVPSGTTPTTHILKPPIAGFEGHAENEHLCLALAGALGLPTARSEVTRYEDEVAIVVERYDRNRRNSGSVERLHQEDMCQVMGLPPNRKYQSDGGPGCAAISKAIWSYSKEPRTDVRTFARATLLNWIIAGTDAHAKNFSMLIGPGAGGRLAPLYDIASVLPYESDPRNIKMATSVGGEYQISSISGRHWIQFADDVSLRSDEVLDMGRAMVRVLPEVFSEIVGQARADGLNHPILARMVDLLSARSKQCANILKIVK